MNLAATAIRRDAGVYQAVTDVSMVEPWRWQVGPRRYYLVSALSFGRI
jgi:hypothetical protein